MLKRRNFLQWSSILTLSSLLKAKEHNDLEIRFNKVEKIILEIQQHMFPPDNRLPSAKEINSIYFLRQTLFHKSFDKDIRLFIIKGAEKFHKREKNFNLYPSYQKEESMRFYENTRYGKNWLGRIMTMTMEGMFSDPIYGSNTKELGWKAINSYGGFPRATKRYLEDV